MNPLIHRAFFNELEKIAFNQEQIRQQGAQMVQQGTAMQQNPLAAMSQIRQHASLTANNPAAKPAQAAQMMSLVQSTQPGLHKTAAYAFIDELERVYGYELDDLTKEAMFGAAAKVIGGGIRNGVGAVKTVAANPMMAANNAAMKIMTSPGMQTMVHNPAVGTAMLGQQVAGGIGQMAMGQGLSTGVRTVGSMLPGAIGSNISAVGSALGHVV